MHRKSRAYTLGNSQAGAGFLLLLLILLMTSAAQAFTCSATGCTFTISYTEPTTNTDGSPIALQATTIYYTLGIAPEKSLTVPATQPSGGGTVTRAITEPILPGQTVSVVAQASATSTTATGARSAQTDPLVIANAAQVDTIPPPAPSSPVVAQQAVSATSVTFSISWAPSIDQPGNLPVPIYTYSAGYNDGSAPMSGQVAVPSMTLVMPYHVSGAASPAFLCVKAVDAAGNASTDQACSGMTVPAKPAPAQYTLGVTVTGPGTTAPSGITAYPAGQVVTITATPVASATFTNWAGACAGTTPTCAVTMDASKTVAATFTQGPLPPTSAPNCLRRVTAMPPDTTTGWTLQLRDGTANLGAAVNNAPYQRDVTLTAGAHSITARWTKSTTILVSPASVMLCP